MFKTALLSLLTVFLALGSLDAQWDIIVDTAGVTRPSDELIKKMEMTQPRLVPKVMTLSVPPIGSIDDSAVPFPLKELETDGDTIMLEKYNGSISGEVFGSIGYIDSLPNLNKALYLPAGSWARYSGNFSPLSREGSIEMMVAPTAYGATLLTLQWYKTNSPPSSGYVLVMGILPSGAVTYGVWNTSGGGWLAGTTPVKLNAWNHIGVSWDATGSRIYVNGKLDAHTSAVLFPATPYYAYFGDWGRMPSAYIDEVRISKKARVRDLTPECKTLNVPYLSQADGRWGDKMYDHLASSISRKGCAITAACMVMLYHGVSVAADGKEVNPANMNEWLKREGSRGYIKEGPRTGDLRWAALEKYSNNKIKWSGFGTSSVALKEFLDSDNPLILHVPGSPLHFVVATGEKCTKTWTINDPNPAKGQTDLETGYGVTKDNIDDTTSARLLKKAQTDFSGVYLYVNTPPAEFLVTDPHGKRTGYLNGEIITDVPNSYYGKEGIGDIEIPTSEEPSALTLHLGVRSPAQGTYLIKVVGIDHGVYYFDIDTKDREGEYSIGSIVTKGLTDKGIEHEYKLNYSPIPGEPVKLVKVVTFDTLKGEVNVARKLNFIDNNGVRNSLIQKINNARNAHKRGQKDAAVNILEALLNEIEAQKDKHISAEAALILSGDAKILIEEIKK